MMTPELRGLYVHIPFCLKKCAYCDFCSYPNLSDDVRHAYVNALIAEIRSYKRKNRIGFDTVFFGGGTPSLLGIDETERIFSAIRESFLLAPDAEITLEANPKTLTADKLAAYKSFGVNRLSIGLQTIHENELKKLGRIHNYDDFLESYSLARKAGFDNISVDVMYGIPEQTASSFERTLDAVIYLSPEHISSYGLIIEEGTPFFDMRDSLALPSEDAECDMYELACEKLRLAGYLHYEISNYSRAKRKSRHNLHYWRAEEYIGVGVSAYSYYDGKRFSNPASIEGYLAVGKPDISAVKPESQADLAFEYAMLALRLTEGLSLDAYKKRFGTDFIKGREASVKKYISLGYMTATRDRLALTERGFYVSNAILSDLL